MELKEELAAESNTLVAKATSFLVTSQETFEAAAAVRVALREIKKKITDATEPFVAAAFAAHKAAKAQQKTLLKPSEDADEILVRKMDEYARAEAEKKRIADAALQKKIEAAKTPEAVERIVEKAAAAPVLAPPTAKGVAVVEEWFAEVINPAILPREYLVPDLKKIEAVAKTLKGDTKIPGVRVFSEVRTKGTRT